YSGKLQRVISQSIGYEAFGELLIESGLFDPDTLNDLLAIQKTSDTPRRLGEILKDYGIDNSCIKETLFSQIRSLIAQLMAMKEGSFSLHLNRVPSEELPAGIRQIKLDEPMEVMDLLLWAAQELDELYMETCRTESITNVVSIISMGELQ